MSDSAFDDGITAPDSVMTMAEAMGSDRYRALSTPHVAPGEPAPDIDLPRLDGRGFFHLSEHRGKRPVALIFGSYT